MNHNSDGSNLSENSFNGSRMAEISRELSGQANNRDLGSDSDCNRDIDYRYFLKILMERDRSPNWRESSSSRSQWAENSREHRRDQIRNCDRGRDGEWNRPDDECNREKDRSFPPYNYNATDLLNSFVDGNRRDLSMMPAYNNDSISPMSTPWNINSMDGMTMSQNNVNINQCSSAMPMPPNLEMAQPSNSNFNPMSTPWNINPMDGMTMSQSNMSMNQNSFAMSVPPNLEMAQTSNSSINPMSTPWNINPMNQSNMTVDRSSSAAPESSNLTMVHTANSKVNPKRTRWNNPMEDVNTNQNNMTMNQSSSAVPENTQENNFSLPVNEIIELTKSVLYPPNPIAPRPSTREKPRGCKTVFVGGLPAKTTEEIIKEIFEKCGAIEKVSLSPSKKYFCHIRFFDEASVENAVKLSGYRLKIENKDEISYSSRIHVDYAQAKDDLRDYERKQRTLWCRGEPVSAQNDIKNQNNVTVNPSSAVPMSSGLEIREASNMSGNACAFMTGIGKSPVYHVIAPQKINFTSPVKEVIQFTKSVLYPPHPSEPPPTTRIKPRNCKTVFVGGLPHEITKEIVKDIFGTCGAISGVRFSRSNFCHIQFRDELSVENALYFSGYTLKIENRDEAPFNGKLHVHYSLVKEDERDYEHKQRSLPSDSVRKETISHYTEYESSRICEKLKHEETFSQAASVLINWLERGECKKKEAGGFYSMIQCTQSQVKKLQDDKVKYEETLNQAKSLFKKLMDGNIQKFNEIEKIFNAASLQKNWDNFTKTQRKNIEMWRKQSEEIKNAHLEEVINEREDEEMELSDDENDALKKNDVGQVKSQYKEYTQKLQEEVSSLKCQLAAAHMKIKAAQSEEEESKNKDNQLSAIRTALQNSMKEVLDLNQKYSKAEAELKELRGLKCTKEGEQNEDNDLSRDGDDAGVSSSINLDKSINVENDVRLVSLLSAFLIVQPFGATVDYIWPYLHQMDSSVNTGDVENLMKRFPTLFKEESSGTESSNEKKWKFIGFQTYHTIS